MPEPVMMGFLAGSFRLAHLLALFTLVACQAVPPRYEDDVFDRFEVPARGPFFAGAIAPSQVPTPFTLPMPSIEVAPFQLALEPATVEAPPDLWARLRKGYALAEPSTGDDPKLAERVAAHVRWYQQHPVHLARTWARARWYLHDIVEALALAGMPLELAFLPAVESAFQPNVCSRAAACGLWQFMAATGRRFDLKQDFFVDERRHIRASTAAALRYLKELHTRFDGDWQLALAAYNCGEGCVEKAVHRARAAGLSGRFTDLAIPQETVQYVPRLLALAQMVAAPQDHGLALPTMVNAPAFKAVAISRDVDLVLAASWAGMTVPEFTALNPQHQKPVIVVASNPYVFLPIAQVQPFELAKARHQGAMSSWRAVTVRTPSSIETLARLHGGTEVRLREVNGVGAKQWIQAGSTVLIPRRGINAGDEITVATTVSARLETIPAPRSAEIARNAKQRSHQRAS